MKSLVFKAIATCAKLPDAGQEAIALDLLTRAEADAHHRQVKLDVHVWLHNVQSHFADIEIPPREQPSMPRTGPIWMTDCLLDTNAASALIKRRPISFSNHLVEAIAAAS